MESQTLQILLYKFYKLKYHLLQKIICYGVKVKPITFIVT